MSELQSSKYPTYCFVDRSGCSASHTLRSHVLLPNILRHFFACEIYTNNWIILQRQSVCCWRSSAYAAPPSMSKSDFSGERLQQAHICTVVCDKRSICWKREVVGQLVRLFSPHERLYQSMTSLQIQTSRTSVPQFQTSLSHSSAAAHLQNVTPAEFRTQSFGSEEHLCWFSHDA